MGLAITLGVIIALAIGLLMWARGAIAAAERRHTAQVRINEAISAARTAGLRTEAAGALSSRRLNRSPDPVTPRRSAETTTYAAASTWADYGSSSDSYSSGGSCSSGSGDAGGGGCD